MTEHTTHPTPLRQVDVSGIRTLHLPRPGLTRCTLHVGVGWADETFSTRGVTHVIEHLAMGTARGGKFEANACVAAHRTTFWANGRPDQVAPFLTRVVRALGDLPLERIDRERGVLEAEAGEGGYGPHEATLKMRFGNQGLGLGVFPGLGPLATEPSVVLAHARRWFVRDNAVLTVVGDIPDGLDLRLPAGDVPGHLLERSFAPGVVAFDVGDPILSFEAPDVPEASLALRLMASRLEESLRHDRGLVYAMVPEIVRLPGEGRLVLQLAAQVAPGAAREVAEALAGELSLRAEAGASADEITDDLEWWDAAGQDPDHELADLDLAAERMLAGLPVQSLSEARAQVAALDPDAVRTVVRDALPSVLLIVPRGVEPDTTLVDGAGCTSSRRMTASPLRRRFRSSAPRGNVLGFTDEVVEHLDEDGDVHTIRFDECVGVGVSGRARLLFGARGCCIWVDPRDFRGADAAVRLIDARVPAGARFDLDG